MATSRALTYIHKLPIIVGGGIDSIDAISVSSLDKLISVRYYIIKTLILLTLAMPVESLKLRPSYLQASVIPAKLLSLLHKWTENLPQRIH